MASSTFDPGKYLQSAVCGIFWSPFSCLVTESPLTPDQLQDPARQNEIARPIRDKNKQYDDFAPVNSTEGHLKGSSNTGRGK